MVLQTGPAEAQKVPCCVADLGGVAETPAAKELLAAKELQAAEEQLAAELLAAELMAAKELLAAEKLGPTRLRQLALATPLALLAFADHLVGGGVQARVPAALFLAVAANPKVDFGSQQFGVVLSLCPHRQLEESTWPLGSIALFER